MLCVLRLRTKAPNAVRATYCSNAPNTKSLKSLKNAAMEIQKQLIQQTKKWPLESGREDRSLKHDLLTRLEKQQTELNDSSDPKQVLELGQQAQDELVAITDLLTNKHFKKHKLEVYAVPDVVEKQEKLLSSKSQKKMKNRQWGIFDRFLTWYLDEETDGKDKKTKKP